MEGYIYSNLRNNIKFHDFWSDFLYYYNIDRCFTKNDNKFNSQLSAVAEKYRNNKNYFSSIIQMSNDFKEINMSKKCSYSACSKIMFNINDSGFIYDTRATIGLRKIYNKNVLGDNMFEKFNYMYDAVFTSHAVLRSIIGKYEIPFHLTPERVIDKFLYLAGGTSQAREREKLDYVAQQIPVKEYNILIKNLSGDIAEYFGGK